MAMLTLALLGFAAVLGFVVIITIGAYGQAEEKTRPLLLTLAWAAAGTLAVTLVMLGWILSRWLRLRQNPGRSDTPRGGYINAWDEAGKRLAVTETDTIIEPPDKFATDDLPPEDDENPGLAD
jgi:hypothetical protein